MSLKRNISYNDIVEALESIGINKKLSIDELFGEFIMIRFILPVVIDSEDFTVKHKWVILFNVKAKKKCRLLFCIA